MADAGEIVDVTRVYIEQDLDRKPYLGGFRNKHSGREYHHALYVFVCCCVLLLRCGCALCLGRCSDA